MILEEIPICDVCGSRCIDGYELRGTGRRERETGYQDEQIVCASCLDYGDSDDERYAEADRAYDMARD